MNTKRDNSYDVAETRFQNEQYDKKWDFFSQAIVADTYRPRLLRASKQAEAATKAVVASSTETKRIAQQLYARIKKIWPAVQQRAKSIHVPHIQIIRTTSRNVAVYLIQLTRRTSVYVITAAQKKGVPAKITVLKELAQRRVNVPRPLVWLVAVGVTILLLTYLYLVMALPSVLPANNEALTMAQGTMERLW